MARVRTASRQKMKKSARLRRSIRPRMESDMPSALNICMVRSLTRLSVSCWTCNELRMPSFYFSISSAKFYERPKLSMLRCSETKRRLEPVESRVP